MYHFISPYQNRTLFRHIVPPETELPVLRGPPRVKAVVSQRERVGLATRHRNHPVDITVEFEPPDVEENI